MHLKHSYLTVKVCKLTVCSYYIICIYISIMNVILFIVYPIKPALYHWKNVSRISRRYMGEVTELWLSCYLVVKLYVTCFYQYLGTVVQGSVQYSDDKMSAMPSQITGVSIVCLTVCLGADKKKHQSSASPVFVSGIPSQRASNAENVSIWWYQHAQCWSRHI